MKNITKGNRPSRNLYTFLFEIQRIHFSAMSNTFVKLLLYCHYEFIYGVYLLVMNYLNLM
jgi:hypothetical protein